MDIKAAAEQLLGRKLEPADGISSERLLRVEHGLKLALPEPLKRLYSLVGNREQLTESFQRIVPPEQLERKAGKLYFAEENQGVCGWAVDLREGIVYQTSGDEMYSEGVDLECFLILLMFYNCAQGGFEYCAVTTEMGLGEIQAQLQEGWTQVVSHNGLQIYAKEDHLIWWLMGEDGQPLDGMVYLSSRTESGLEKYGGEFEMYEL